MRMIIGFAGSLEVQAEDVVMVEVLGSMCTSIRGDEWLKLPEQDRQKYVLNSFSDTFDASDHVEFSQLDIDIE